MLSVAVKGLNLSYYMMDTRQIAQTSPSTGTASSVFLKLIYRVGIFIALGGMNFLKKPAEDKTLAALTS